MYKFLKTHASYDFKEGIREEASIAVETMVSRVDLTSNSINKIMFAATEKNSGSIVRYGLVIDHYIQIYDDDEEIDIDIKIENEKEYCQRISRYVKAMRHDMSCEDLNKSIRRI